MIDWFLPPNIASDSRLILALQMLEAASSVDEIRHILEEWPHILFSERVFVVLCLTLARELIQGESQHVDDIRERLYLLEDSRINGTDQAIQRLVDADEDYVIPSMRTIELLTNALA